MMRRALWSALLAVLFLIGCRKSPPLSPPPTGGAETSYVGIADLGGATNVLVVFTEPSDSADSLTGSVTYRSQTSIFSELFADSATDSIYFEYSRNSENFRAWAQRQAFSMVVHILEPPGVLPFALNLELDGHNMTGLWTGEMSSTALQGQRPADMIMTQVGTAYDGDVQVNFFELWSIDIAQGGTSGNAFTLTGTVYGSDSYPIIWQGSYLGFDSISGTWDAGEQPVIDRGEFLLTRSFR